MIMKTSIITLCVAAISLSAATASGTVSGSGTGLPNDSVAATANDTTENTAVDLEELEVKANTVVMDGKRTTLIPTPRDKKFASDGIGILRNMAQANIVVNPLDQSVTNAAGVPYSFFIDYVPASDRQVRDIRPQDVLRVEVTESPEDPRFNGARIAANFIMRKYEYGGYTKFSGTHIFPASYGDYNAYSKLSYKKMTYDVSGGTGFMNITSLNGTDSESTYRFGNKTLTRIQTILPTRALQLMPYVTARAVYSTDGIMISNSLGYNGIDQRFNIGKGSVEYPGQTQAEEFIRKSDKSLKSLSWKGMFYFSLPKRFSINLNGSASRTLNDDWSSYMVGSASPIVNDITEKEWKTDGDITVTKKFGAHSVGASIFAGWRENRLDYRTDAITELEYRESYINFYLNSSFNIGNFNISPGISASHSDQTINGKMLSRWYPKAFIPAWVRINDRQSAYLSFEYSKGIATPTEMNPVLVRRNDIDAVEGNEDLGYFDFYLGRLGYNVSFGRFSANISGDATYYGNTIVPVYTPRYGTGESPMMVQSFANDGSMFYGNAMLRLSAGLLGSSLQLQLYGAAHYFHRSGLYARAGWDWGGGASATYYIRSFQISAGYSTPSVYHSSVSDQRYPSYYYLNGTWAWNGLYIGLSFRSPFRKSLVCYTSGIDAGDYINNETYYNTTYRQNIELTVTYSFGYGKKTSKDDEVSKIGGGNSIILK